MYKKSNYNIEIEVLDNGDVLLFNTMTTAFGIMDTLTKCLYDRIEQLESNDIDIIKEDKNFQTLLQYGYIVPKELNELDILKLRSQSDKYTSKSLSLTIAPTLNCNMACPYCYEKKQNICMEESVKIVLYDFVENFLITNGCKNFHVTWYGGEPLMEVDTIYDLSSKFINLCNSNNIDYSASIVTNGVLFERNIAIKLRDECNVNMAQITIDGMPEYHNIRRILIDGRDSFDIIVNNIEACKDIMKISIRVNVDKSNISNIEKLSDYFIYEKNWVDNPSFYLAPVEKYNDNCCFNNDECLNTNEFSELDSGLLNKLYSANKKNIKQLLYPPRKGNFCGAVQYGCYVVDPEGDLYTCWNVVGQKEKKIGNVIQKKIMNIEYMKWLLHEPSGKCLLCNLLPICYGGCPYEFFNNGEPMCAKKIQNYKESLKLAYKDYISNKNSVK